MVFEAHALRDGSSLSSIMKPDNDLQMYNGIVEYCAKYNIPRDNLLDILEDQKVLPMIRGKATEYVGAAFLRQVLDPREWSVDKLNLNPQAGRFDEDISITFRFTGQRFKAETKNAVRGGFKLRSRNVPVPHFQVKCHKSRSNLTRQSTTNDRYLVGEFDLLLCNVSNAIFKGKPLASGLPLIQDQEALEWLKEFYGVKTDAELARSTYDDWRLCLPLSIADGEGVIPRNPVVRMIDDSDWFKDDSLAHNLRSLINGL